MQIGILSLEDMVSEQGEEAQEVATLVERTTNLSFHEEGRETAVAVDNCRLKRNEGGGGGGGGGGGIPCKLARNSKQ
eukprot:768479-Hanusia_phi.AAC.4